MEPPRKLNLLERASRISSCDRFSDLPDYIIHHIFSFVCGNDLVKVSILSRRFRQLFISSPYLFFRGNHDKYPRYCPKKCKKFTTYVTDTLRARDGMKLYRFDLDWNCDGAFLDNEKEALLNLWFQYALNCQVEEIVLRTNISFSDKNPYVLPRCIFRCSSLRVLRLNFCRNCSLKLQPEEFDFSSLQVLTLSRVTLREDDLGKWISTYLKSLKKLRLHDVDGMEKLRIENSSLEYLSISHGYSKFKSLTVSAMKLQTLSINTGTDLHGPEKRILVKIKAPNLQTFTWKGDSGIRFSGNFNALNYASVHDMIRDATCDSIVEILRSVSQARVLQVHISAIEDLFAEDRLPILFDHVDHLIVTEICSRDCQIPAIASFFRGLPILRTLNINCKSKSRYWESSEESISDDIEYEEHPGLLFSHLKKVKVKIVKENEDLRLVKYFLKFAKQLEKMTLFCSNSFLKELAMSGIPSFETASSGVCIYFLHQKEDEDLYY